MSTNASSPAALPGTTLRPKHGGRSALHLDAAPVRVGDWLSGVVEIPERFRGADLRLYVECVHRFEFNDLRSFRWYGIELLDGARLEHQAGKLFIPIAVQLPADAPPTSHDILNKQRVDWVLRVQAIRPGASYRLLFESEFEVAVEPSHEAAPPAPATTPRSMPLLTPEEVATRLDARASTVGDTLLIRFPFPAGAATTTFVAASVFALNGLAYVVPGLPWGLPLDPDVHLAIGVVSGGVAAVFLFILLDGPRRRGPARERAHPEGDPRARLPHERGHARRGGGPGEPVPHSRGEPDVLRRRAAPEERRPVQHGHPHA